MAEPIKPAADATATAASADILEEAPTIEEPKTYWEKEEVANQIARFNPGDGSKADDLGDIPMLVAVRVRPLWEKEEVAGDYSTVQVLESKVVVVLDPWYDADLNPNRAKEKKYAFDVVFDVEVNQDEVYQSTARGLVGGVLDGYNSSVFAYGATGAGKTHTMLGSLEHPGVMVNTLHDMFVRMKDPSFTDAKFKVTLSYMEIYNELIKDLLQPTSVDLKLNEDPARGMVVQGITEYGADSADEILELLHRGNMHRAVEPTAANQVSSRSHAVLQITVEQSERTAHVTGNVRIGKLSMVDLAGSERASKTDNTGQRLKEGANINRSLLALGNCITALADKNRKGHVPFRDSKMTRLLKDSLGGNCRTVMIANISPSHRQFEETINTLKYANRAKNLKTQVARNVVSVSAHIAEYQRVIMELRNEVADLKAEIKQGGGRDISVTATEQSVGSSRKQRSLDYVDNLEKQHMQQLKDAIMSAMSERKRLLQRLTDHSRALSEARVSIADDKAGQDKDSKGSDAAAQPPDAGAHSELHAALAETRRHLQQNQQTINEIVATAVQRISSQERLQLLQLLVRGKFLEVMNEEMGSELDMRRSLTQAAMRDGALPPNLMNEAMTTESWYTEHRAALDYHAKMAKTQMGGSLHAPSIAQLLDQNLVTPQQASASQNLGELVRPFTNQNNNRGPSRSLGKQPLHDASRGGGGGLLPKGKRSAGSVSPSPGAGPSSGAGSSALLSNLALDDDDEDRKSSTSASEKGSGLGGRGSASSSRKSSSQRPRGLPGGSGAPNPNALRGLRQPGRPNPNAGARPTGGGRTGSADSRTSPQHSLPPTPSSSRPPSNSRQAGGPTTTITKLNSNLPPPQRVKRFVKPPPPSNPSNPRLITARDTVGLPALNVSALGSPQGRAAVAVQLTSARAPPPRRPVQAPLQQRRTSGASHDAECRPGPPRPVRELSRSAPSERAIAASRRRRPPHALRRGSGARGAPKLID